MLRLTCGMIGEKFAGDIIKHLITKAAPPRALDIVKRLPWHIALAVQCLGELRNPSAVSETAGRLLNAVFALLDQYIRGFAGRVVSDEVAQFLLQQVVIPTE